MRRDGSRDKVRDQLRDRFWLRDQARGGAWLRPVHVVWGIRRTARNGEVFKSAEVLIEMMSTVVGGCVSMGLAEREGSAPDVLLTKSMAAG